MKYILILYLNLCFGFLAFAQGDAMDPNRIAVEGYDLVSYFNNAEPIKGREAYRVTYQNKDYYFASVKNRLRFLAMPEHYLPAFGGWCAYAMAKGKRVEINPLAFIVENEKLYLFYKTIFTDTRAKWIRSADNLRPLAEKHWEELKGLEE